MKEEKEAQVFFEDFIDFNVDKQLSTTCNVCNEDPARWTVTGLPNISDKYQRPVPSLVNGILTDDGWTDDLTFSGVPVITSMCNNCGNMRLFSYKKILDWKRAKQAVDDVASTQAELPQENENGG